MARQAPRRNQHDVKTQFEFRMLGMRHQPGLGCADDPLLLPRRDGIGSFVEAAAGLDLDEGEKLTVPRHNIDLT